MKNFLKLFLLFFILTLFIFSFNTTQANCGNNFTQNLKLRTVNDEVKILQNFLNNNGYIVATTGNGSLNNETTYFGNLTKKAVIKYQKDNNLPPTGYFGPLTRAKINECGGGSEATITHPVVTYSGGGTIVNYVDLNYTAGANGTLTGNSTQRIMKGNGGLLITAVPNLGYHFTTWSDGILTATRTDTNVRNDINVTANFSINDFTLTSSAGSNGSITPTATADYGSSKTFNMTPDLGYHIVDVLVDTVSQGTITTYTFTNITANHTISVTFAIDTHTLTYAAGTNGTLTGTASQTVDYGSDGTSITANPDPHYHFVDWSDASTDNPRTDTNITGDVTVTANFAINTFTLTYTAGTNGTLTGTDSQTVNYGSDGTAVTAVADPNYSFLDWSDGVLTATRTDLNITSNLSVTANFTARFSLNAGGYKSGKSIEKTSDGGYITVGQSASTNSDFYFVKITSTGALDTTFNPGGLVPGTIAVGVAGTQNGRAVIQTLDGGYIAVGNDTTATDIYVVKLTSTGVLDTTFNSGALLPLVPGTISFGGAGTQSSSSILQASDGSYFVFGSTSTGANDILIAKLTSAGVLDTSFGTGGMKTMGNGAIYEECIAAAKTSDGGYVLAGRINAANGDNYIVKLDSAGNLDTTFGSGTGTVTVNEAVTQQPTSVVQTFDGGYLIVGSNTEYDISDMFIVKLNSDGSFDTNFNSTGKLTIQRLLYQGAYSVAETHDNKYIINGQDKSATLGDFMVVRLNYDGSLDTSFGTGGIITIDISSGDQRTTGAYHPADTDGSFVWVGFSSDPVNYSIMIFKMDKYGRY